MAGNANELLKELETPDAGEKVDGEALKLDPQLELFAKTANADQLTLRIMQAFASNGRMDKALVYALKVLESKTAPKADKLAVLSGANWTVRRSQKTMVSNTKDTVKYEEYWNGLIGMTDCGSRMSRYYRVNTVLSIDEAESNRLAADNLKYRKMLLELSPAGEKAQYELAVECISQGNIDEALPLLEKLYKRSVPSADAGREVRGFHTDVCMWYGNALFIKGDRRGAFDVMEKYLADGVFDTQVRGGWSMGKRDAEFYLYVLRDGGRFDDIKLPHYTGAKAYPEPKEADYSEKFVPLSNVKLELGSGLAKTDSRVRYLTQKLKAYGIKIGDSAPFTIRVNTGSTKAPEKTEGYIVKISDNGADIQGFDRAGTTWAVSTFVQLIDRENGAQIRLCTVRDWPDLKFRGNWGKDWDIRFPEYFITSKLNLSAIGSYLDMSFWSIGVMKPMTRAAQIEYIKLLRELGITVYVTMPTSWYMPKTSERTLTYYAELCNEIAGAGGNVWWLHDDSSAGGQPEWDMKECNGDIYKAVLAEFSYLNALHSSVKKNHPDFNLLFSPIYYFFDDGQHYNGIPKNEYMRDLGKMLDKDIKVMWCGTRVRTTNVKKEELEHWKTLALRKPVFWQNPYGPHEAYHIVLGDCYPGWSDFHYKGFFDDITMYFDAGSISIRGALLMEYANFSWDLARKENCPFEVSEATQRLAYDICYGKGALEVIKPGSEAIWVMDPYPTFFSTAMRHDHRTNVQRALMEYERVMSAIDKSEYAWARMQELYGQALKVIPTQYVDMAGRERLGKPMQAHLKTIGREAMMREAAAAGHYSTNAGDQFKSAAEFYGGGESAPVLYAKNDVSFDPGTVPYHKKVFGAGAKTVYADNNKASSTIMPSIIVPMDQLETKFFRSPDMKGDCELILCGNNEIKFGERQNCRIAVILNGETVFEGTNSFPHLADELVLEGAKSTTRLTGAFGFQKLVLPAKLLKETNTIVIRNLEAYDSKPTVNKPDGNTPYFSLKYAVIRKK